MIVYLNSCNGWWRQEKKKILDDDDSLLARANHSDDIESQNKIGGRAAIILSRCHDNHIVVLYKSRKSPWCNFTARRNTTTTRIWTSPTGRNSSNRLAPTPMREIEDGKRSSEALTSVRDARWSTLYCDCSNHTDMRERKEDDSRRDFSNHKTQPPKWPTIRTWKISNK